MTTMTMMTVYILQYQIQGQDKLTLKFSLLTIFLNFNTSLLISESISPVLDSFHIDFFRQDISWHNYT